MLTSATSELRGLGLGLGLGLRRTGCGASRRARSYETTASRCNTQYATLGTVMIHTGSYDTSIPLH